MIEDSFFFCIFVEFAILICSSYFHYAFSLPMNLLYLLLLLNALYECRPFLLVNGVLSSIIGKVVALVTCEECIVATKAFLLRVLTITKSQKVQILLSYSHRRCHCYGVGHSVNWHVQCWIDLKEKERTRERSQIV